MTRNTTYVILAVVAVLVVGTGVAIARLDQRDRVALTGARSAIASGRYDVALSDVSLIRIPWHQAEADTLRSAVAAERARDTEAWSALKTSAKAMAGAAADRNGSGAIPDGVVADFADGLRTALNRPSVGDMSTSKLRSRFAVIGLPKGAAVAVNDLRSPHHSVRTVRFVVSNPDTFSTGPSEDRNSEDCFKTGITCWYFNAAASRLFVSVPAGSDMLRGVYEIRAGTDDASPPGTFQGARLLDWHGGIALALAGSYAASNGGNNGETWWHLWRLSHDGKVQLDGDAIPFKTGVDGLTASEARGVLGKSFGEESTPFDECHACPHIRREFVASWNVDEGRYRVVSTRIHPSPYAALVRYIQAEERGNTLLDSSADLPHLRALKAFINRASSNGLRCEAVSGDDYGLTGTVAEIRLRCGYLMLAAKAVRHGANWSLSDAYSVSE